MEKRVFSLSRWKARQVAKAMQQQNLFAVGEVPELRTAWEQAAAEDRLYAEIVFNLPLSTGFHYLVPDSLRELIAPGQRVEVPFGAGNKRQVGYCVALTHESPTTRQLKSIHAILDKTPLLTAQMLDLTKWIADRYLCTWGQVLDSIIPAGVKSGAGTRELLFFRLAEGLDLGSLHLPKKQKAVVEILSKATAPMRGDDLAEAAGCGTAPINGLREKGIIVAERTRTLTSLKDDLPREAPVPIHLNEDQDRAVRAVVTSMRHATHETFLLHGVTGSGKTEVYIRIIEEAVSYGRQAIVLVPEISLTPQTIRRFRSRFKSVAVLHSHLTDVERHAHWQQIARGEVQVVVGARSAIFAPTPHLGVIVIDEEHETSFKQDMTPRYHAREVARRRAEVENIPLILGTATPTLESWRRIQEGKDKILSLPKRVAQRPLPPVVVVDTRHDPAIQKGGSIGRALQQAMISALKKGGQVILFLNVRGYSPVLWCQRCGEGVQCPDCDLTLTWHKQRGVALCHSCDYETPVPQACPTCGKPGLKSLGHGTERLEAEVKARFPDATVLRMDSDTMKQRGSHDEALEAFRHGKVQILLGTQMIAKGLDFPNVTLVGVVDADTSLHQPDFRAGERTFQLIAQVAGRTGRGDRGGRVLVQTASPMQPSIVAAAEHNYEKFATAELENRQLLSTPPFVHLVRIILRGPNEKDVLALSENVRALLEKEAKARGSSIRILGPAPCPVTRLKNLFRYHLQLSAPDLAELQSLWESIVPQLKVEGDLELVVDVDPMNLR